MEFLLVIWNVYFSSTWNIYICADSIQQQEEESGLRSYCLGDFEMGFQPDVFSPVELTGQMSKATLLHWAWWKFRRSLKCVVALATLRILLQSHNSFLIFLEVLWSCTGTLSIFISSVGALKMNSRRTKKTPLFETREDECKNAPLPYPILWDEVLAIG